MQKTGNLNSLKMTKTLFILIFAFIGIILFSCKKDSPENNEKIDFGDSSDLICGTETAQRYEMEYMGETVSCVYINGRYVAFGDIIVQDDNIENSDPTKAAVEIGAKKWIEGKVFYYSQSQTLNNEVEKRMKLIENKVPGIKFIELKTDFARRVIKNKVFFVQSNEEEGSHSAVGMQSIIQNCYIYKPSAILHEIGHVLGLMHEHQREDRDGYIKIDNNNIIGNYDKNITPKVNINKDYYYSAFDTSSVMMYNSRISKIAKDPNKPIITTITGKEYSKINPEILSKGDSYVLNKIYNTYQNPDILLHFGASDITSNSCILKGELVYGGNPIISEYGFLVTDQDTHIEGFIPKQKINNVGEFESTVTGLRSNATYLVQTYYKKNDGTIVRLNAIGTGEGYEPFFFKTEGLTPIKFYLVANLMMNGVITQYESDVFIYLDGTNDRVYIPSFKWKEWTFATDGNCLAFFNRVMTKWSELDGEAPYGWHGEGVTVRLKSEFNLGYGGHFPEIEESANGSICFWGEYAWSYFCYEPERFGGTFTLTRIE